MHFYCIVLLHCWRHWRHLRCRRNSWHCRRHLRCEQRLQLRNLSGRSPCSHSLLPYHCLLSKLTSWNKLFQGLIIVWTILLSADIEEHLYLWFSWLHRWWYSGSRHRRWCWCSSHRLWCHWLRLCGHHLWLLTVRLLHSLSLCISHLSLRSHLRFSCFLCCYFLCILHSEE